ncbi:hypothetical protein N0V95_008430 [Ascochyta clinopodiicola]|nr:hypothetical protein N0V95_008430 [Ascochyta clinopodiicola]
MHHFAPQLHPDHHSAHSLRADQYRRKRKSKHDQHHDDDQDANSSASDAALTSPHPPPPNSYAHPSFAASELAQLRVAGLAPEQEHRVPPSPFPHAPAKLLKPYLGSAKIRKEVAGPPSRLFTLDNTASKSDHVGSTVESSNLRRTHLNVLSTVMHKCLLQGDYDRAGRAWGMILRTQAPRGNLVDLRNHGRWAIGAEILLRRKPRGVSQSTQDQEESAAHTDMDPFSEEGFELAREYYERLIVQHPTRKQAPHVVDQRSFYPAMFSLWIQQVYEKSRRARKLYQREARRSRSRSRSIDSSHSNDNSPDEAASSENAIQVEELAQATEIAERLDDLVKSPPFDKQASLLQLRGTIALWISDLVVGNTAATIVDEWDVYPISKDTPAAEQITKFNNCQRELHTAQNYLARVEENGGPRQHHTLLKIESRLKELQKQISILRLGGEEDANVSMDDGW